MSESKDRRRRARATLIWALALFVAAQLAGGLLLDYPFWRLRFPSAASVLQHLEQEPSPQVVVLGSSRVAGIVPAEVEPLLAQDSPGHPCGVINGSIPAGDAISSKFVLDKLLQAGARPRLVVVEVLPENLSSFNEWQSFHARRQYRWEDLPEHFREMCWSGQALRFLSARLFALHLHRGQVRYALKRAVLPEEPSSLPRPAAPLPAGPVDWARVLTPPDRKMPPELAAYLRVADEPKRFLRWFAIGGDCPAALDQILQRGQEHGFQVMLVAPPVTQVYRSAYTAAIEAEFQHYLAGVQQRYPCTFIDCRDWVDDALFMDTHHLRKEDGEGYFSRLFTYRVLAPWWQNEHGRLAPGEKKR
jgi:hypothetical protein